MGLFSDFSKTFLGGNTDGGLSEKLFGGNNNSQQEEQKRQNDLIRRYTQQQVEQSRSDTNALYNRGNQARNYGYNQALGVQQQAMPVQAQYFQGGNVAAQNAILGGTPQVYQAPQIDPSYFNYQMPTYEALELERVPIEPGPQGSNNRPRDGGSRLQDLHWMMSGDLFGAAATDGWFF